MPRIPTLPNRKWNRTTAAHLATRAGFGPTPSQLNALEEMKPAEAVDSFLTFPAENTRNQAPDWFHEENAAHRFPDGLSGAEFRKLSDEERRKLRQKSQKQDRQHIRNAQAWWLERMVNSPHQLEEKLTLFFHGHFATSAQKVNGAYPMLNQNLTLREKGTGTWRDMLEAISKDPAMLVYLDNARSNRRKPNENYARELMELFTLGEGHYTEDDIRNSARAFTGWSLNAEVWEFQERKQLHDQGNKRFMGESGRFDGNDIINLILKNPQAADFLVDRLWRFFASDTPHPQTLKDLAGVLKASDFSIKETLRALFLHEDFYHPECIRTQIKSPVQLTVDLARTLNHKAPPGGQMSNACIQLGQTLFAPPSVKGWDGGNTWITASTLAMRYQFAEKLIRKRDSFVPENFLPDRSLSREQIRQALFERFYHHPLGKKEQSHMDKVLASMPPATDWQRNHFVTVFLHLVQQPQFQLT
jgi:uncharacterized protein (DUF1800 family)